MRSASRPDARAERSILLRKGPSPSTPRTCSLEGGHLWHLFSDDTSYVFARESEEERLLVVFNNDSKARESASRWRDTPLQGLMNATRLFR